MSVEFDPSRRDLAALLAPLLLAACAQTPPRRLVSVNLLDTEPTAPPPTPDAGAQLETAFDEARRMTVPVFINGRGPFSFVVDTGANRSVVSRELAAALSLPAEGRVEVHGIAGAESAAMAGVRNFRVGETNSTGLVLPALPRDKLGADGLLGVDVLKGRRVFLDFVQNRFEIAASGSGTEIGRQNNSRIPSTLEPVRVAAQYRFGQLVILDAQVGEVPVSAFIDSGSQVTVGNIALRDAVVRRLPEFGVRLAPVPLISATGQTAMGEFAPLPTLRLGGLAVNQVMGIFADLHIFDLWKLADRPAILIGID
ncbi:MAG: retropepsin-like aspartic protease, partial [Phenylobacterium sp.]